MRCYICDVELSEAEIQLDELGQSEPCTTCWNIIIDTAYSSGFEPGGTKENEAVDPLLETIEEGEI